MAAPYGSGDDPGPREPLSTFAGARAKLATATQDLFRLSGNSIPVEADAISEPPPAPVIDDPVSARKKEASIMFSLEELMKASPAQSPSRRDEASDHLWSTQGAIPLFGTAQDQALLTTPLKRELTSMESMTVPSRRPPVRRFMPLVLAIAAGSAALAGVGWWAFGPKESEARASAEVAAAAVAAEPATGATPSAEGPPSAESAAPPAAAAPPETAAPASADAPATELAAPSDPAQAEVPVAGADESAAEAPASKGTKGKKSSKSKRTKPAASAPAPSSVKAAFDTSAARDALNSAAARAAGCKGTSGKGKVQLTFATTGRVSSAQLVEGPFGGSSAGKCALRHFKAARVPAFSGSPQSVAKSFKIP